MNLSTKPKTKLHFQRFEFKYQVPLDVVEGLIPEFLKYMEFDPYALSLSDHAYTVTSLYYDSIGLGCYYDKLAGLRTRKKLRVRTYSDKILSDTPVFLEIKRKHDNVVIKDRLKMNFRQSQEIIDSNRSFGFELKSDEQETLNEFLWFKNFNSMVPQVMVIYKRKPLFSKTDPNFRVTIDYNLETYQADSISQINDKMERKKIDNSMAIIELKFNNILPFWFHRIIQRYGLEQRPFSKYCVCLEACHPELVSSSLLNAYNPELSKITLNN